MVVLCAILVLYAVIADDPPNVIIIMCDDLGYGDLGFQGNSEIKTPFLDEMSRQGVLLTQFYSAGPVCSPTRSSVLTGRHYFRTGVLDANFGRIRLGEQTLAETLRKYGYKTSMTGKWHIGSLSQDQYKHHPEIGLAYPQWFGFDNSFVNHHKVPTWNPFGADGKLAATYEDPYLHNGERVLNNIVGDDARIIMDRAIKFIDENHESHFLSYVWFHTPHHPVVAGPDYLRLYNGVSSNKRHFYGAITAMDQQVGRLMDRLKELRIENNTIVWFLSDNGPENDINGQYLGSTKGLKGRKRSLFNGGITVPSFVIWNNVIQPNTVVDTPVSALDIYPTVYTIVTGKSPTSEFGAPPLDGVNALPLLQGKANRTTDIPFRFYHINAPNTHALISYPWKLLCNGDAGNPDKNFMLFNLDNDRKEQHNLASLHQDIVTNLFDKLKDWDVSVRNSFNGNDYTFTNASIEFKPDFRYDNIVTKCTKKRIPNCIYN